MSIEHRFDIAFISALALKEKQIQQNYRPVIAVHKWFARRPGTLFRGLLLSEFGDKPLNESFFEANEFSGKLVVDPFMGGGTPILEANRLGCHVQGYDINPMATWIVREEIEQIDLKVYKKEANQLIKNLSDELNIYYTTDCPTYGDKDVPVKYFLWVKTLDCEKCGHINDLFPGNLLADDTRHPLNVLICQTCGELNEVGDIKKTNCCWSCNSELTDSKLVKRNKCICEKCRHTNTYPRPKSGPLSHRMFAIEYFNPKRKEQHKGRFFKKPDSKDLEKYQSLVQKWKSIVPRYVPNQPIPSGDETDRLHRWGYTYYKELFNERQLLGLELSCQFIEGIKDDRIRHALATNLSDLLRYQNMLCRYDTMALKSLDIFSVHGFPVGLVQCESNLLGTMNDKGVKIGSGGWLNIVDKYEKAKQYCDEPFEVKQIGKKKVIIPIKEEKIGERGQNGSIRDISIRCASSAFLELPRASADAVFTDPPYFENVQYGELMDFCYTWLRRLVGTEAEGFDRESTRSPNELTGNNTQARGITHFIEGISSVYSAMAHALKPGAPLAFTFHHNRIEPYYAMGIAILDSGLTCSATLPCPAEMGGSIHIHGTGSSIIDTVFVCRLNAHIPSSQIFHDLNGLGNLVQKELEQLIAGGVKPTQGDIRCILFGHITRIAIWELRESWNKDQDVLMKVNCIAEKISSFGDLRPLIQALFTSNMDQFKTPSSNKTIKNAISV